MSFAVRAHEVIRAAILDDWRAMYLELDDDLDTSEHSDAFSWADAFAFIAEGLEAKALQLTKELFPDTASSAFVLRHAAVIGLARKPATSARLYVTSAGAGSYTTADRLTASTGAVYAPVSDGSSPGDVLVEALEAGSAGNLAPGSPMTWNPAPSGITAAAVVASQALVAVDTETTQALALRVLAWWRERPGGGNRADWAAWGEAHAGVDRAFVYPLRHGTLGPGTLGAVTLCVLAPAPTTLVRGELPVTAIRLVDLSTRNDLKAQLVGTGDYAAEGGLAPGTIHPDDVFVTTPAAVPTDVTLTLTMSSAAPFPFAGTLAFTGVSETQVTVASLPTGLVSGVLVAIPDPDVLGGYAYRTVTVSGSGPWTLTFAAVSATPVPGVLRPLPSNAADIRAAVIAVFNALGPGLGSGVSRRWPDEDELQPPGTLYLGTLAAAVMGVRGLAGSPAGVNGVLNAAVANPVANVVSSPGDMPTLGTLILQSA